MLLESSFLLDECQLKYDSLLLSKAFYSQDKLKSNGNAGSPRSARTEGNIALVQK